MRYHADHYEDDRSVYIADRPCAEGDCQLGSQVHLHVFTDAELRARDERIIREAWRVAAQCSAFYTDLTLVVETIRARACGHQ